MKVEQTARQIMFCPFVCNGTESESQAGKKNRPADVRTS